MGIRKLKKILAGCLIVFFILAPFNWLAFRLENTIAQWSDDTLVINSDTRWTKEDNPSLLFNRHILITDGATLTLEKGTVVRMANLPIEPGWESQWETPPISHPKITVDNGRIVANGTQDEKVIFTTAGDVDRYAIDFENYSDGMENNPEPSFFRFTEFRRGGFEKDTTHGTALKKTPFLMSAYAYYDYNDNIPAFSYWAGRVHMENCLFLENYKADIVAESNFGEGNGDFFEVVNSNFEGNKDGIAVISNNECDENMSADECDGKLLLKNNWYGSANGPTYIDFDSQEECDADGNCIKGNGKQVIGDFVQISGWRKNNMIVDPALIIPGIMGSQQKNGEWKLDLIMHTYDDLIESFEKNGYEKDKNLFGFPYDWKKDNELSAILLGQKVEEVIQKTKVSKVDLAAHSMGGLVARSYIEGLSGADYKNTIDQLVTFGTPHNGSPKSYLSWEGAISGFKFEDKILMRHFSNEAEEAGYDSLQKYIQERVTSVKELLPTYDYLYDVSKSEMRSYPENYPRNSFLEKLNESSNEDKMDSVNWTNIIGKLPGSQSTLSKIRVVGSDVDGKWEHGKPENFGNSETDMGLEYGEGDETVPGSSAENVSADKKITVDGVHSDLPTRAQCDIIEELSGKTDCVVVDETHIPNILMINLFSPVDVQVIAPDGNRVGKNFENNQEIAEIPGAYYTGFDANTEFITIPNPQDGEYQIITQGQGEGEYRVEITKISEDSTAPEGVSESTVTVSGTAKSGKIETEKVTLDEDGVKLVTEDKTAPEISIDQPEKGKTYVNSQVLDIQYAVSDNISPLSNIQIKKYYDNILFSQNSLDLSRQHLGTHSFEIIAQDEAKNENKVTNDFSIATDIKAIQANAEHYYSLKLIKNLAAKKDILKNLKKIEKYLESPARILQNSKISPSFKIEIRRGLYMVINKKITALGNSIKKYPSAYVSKEAKNLLIEQLEYIRPK